mmetsp:Transcript_33316/g.59650  ORF Transcript_33316/g.59650 Transcript_33316/m.59650 type:complete len:256 (+) Transcript_33316:1471-2238(+)
MKRPARGSLDPGVYVVERHVHRSGVHPKVPAVESEHAPSLADEVEGALRDVGHGHVGCRTAKAHVLRGFGRAAEAINDWRAGVEHYLEGSRCVGAHGNGQIPPAHGAQGGAQLADQQVAGGVDECTAGGQPNRVRCGAGGHSHSVVPQEEGVEAVAQDGQEVPRVAPDRATAMHTHCHRAGRGGQHHRQAVATHFAVGETQGPASAHGIWNHQHAMGLLRGDVRHGACGLRACASVEVDGHAATLGAKVGPEDGQ